MRSTLLKTETSPGKQNKDAAARWFPVCRNRETVQNKHFYLLLSASVCAELFSCCLSSEWPWEVTVVRVSFLRWESGGTLENISSLFVPRFQCRFFKTWIQRKKREKTKKKKKKHEADDWKFSENGQVFASFLFQSHVTGIFCEAYVHRGYCVRPKRSLNAMQMQILVFLWLCKKNLHASRPLQK